MRKIKYIIPVLLALVIALVSCVDDPNVGSINPNKYYYDIPDVPVTEDYVVGVMYHELNETYWFKSTNGVPNFNQPEGYTGSPLLGNPSEKCNPEMPCGNETNGGYVIAKDYENNGKILRQQLDWAKQAGIDFFLVSWNKPVQWNAAVKMDTFMMNFKNVWQAGDPKIAFIYDCGHLTTRNNPRNDSLHVNFWRVNPPPGRFVGPYGDGRGTKQTFLDQLDSLKTVFFGEEFYYKVPGKGPLLGLENYRKTNNVQSTVKDVREVLGNVYLISPIPERGQDYTSINIIYNMKNSLNVDGKTKDVYLFRENGEQFGTSQMPFDAMYQPSMLTGNYARHGEDNWRRNFFSIVDMNWKEWKQEMEGRWGGDYIPSVMPAFDNRAFDPDSRIFIHEREVETGELYKNYANVAKLNANNTRRIILINSWNDFKQGSGLEPTEEYGTSYLDFTKKSFKKN